MAVHRAPNNSLDAFKRAPNVLGGQSTCPEGPNTQCLWFWAHKKPFWEYGLWDLKTKTIEFLDPLGCDTDVFINLSVCYFILLFGGAGFNPATTEKRALL